MLAGKRLFHPPRSHRRPATTTLFRSGTPDRSGRGRTMKYTSRPQGALLLRGASEPFWVRNLCERVPGRAVTGEGSYFWEIKFHFYLI